MLAMKSERNLRNTGKQIKEGRYPFRVVEDDMLKCLECGMIVAEGEKYIHGAYHGRYIKTYNEKEEMLTEYAVEKYMETLRGKTELTEDDLQMLEELEYTSTLRSGDYITPHPDYSEYITLLWNTEEFKIEIKPLISKEMYEKKEKEHSSNRCLKVIGDFSFIKLKECEGKKDKSYLDEYGVEKLKTEEVEEKEYILDIEDEMGYDEYEDEEDIEEEIEEEIERVLKKEEVYKDEDIEIDEDMEENPQRVEELLKVMNL